ncbi:MAG: hypothetical protein J2O48_09275 [Solirubrobacterales bacterium]|nr:hypothetical protein [Solirubrobacterales bacterium]
MAAGCGVAILTSVASGATSSAVTNPLATTPTTNTNTVRSTIQTTPPVVTLPYQTSTTSTTTTPQAVNVSVQNKAASQPLPTGFLGFSVEVDAIHNYIGRDPNALNPVFKQLLTGVSQGNPPVLRIGGNSTDYSYVSTPGYLPPAGESYQVIPDWLQTVAALAKQTPARLILGVNLAASNSQMSAVEAREMIHTIGLRGIDALEPGNEPDLYTSTNWYTTANGQKIERRATPYKTTNYQSDFNHWRSVLPNVPLAGGALATTGWMGTLNSLAASVSNLSMVTAHRYPLSACSSPSQPGYPTIPGLLSSAAQEGIATPLAPYAQQMHQAGVSFRLDELNSASCQGKAGVSDTFASSLWMLDTLFDMASVGVDGINVHTLPGSHYAPFSFTNTGKGWTGTVNPAYYGMLAFAQADPPGSDLLSSDDTSTDNGGDVHSFTSRAPDGTLRTTLINEDQTRPATVNLTLPYGSSMSSVSLTAPSLSSTSGVKLGGASFANPTTTGKLGPQTATTVNPVSGTTYQVSVPAGSAEILTGGKGGH